MDQITPSTAEQDRIPVDGHLSPAQWRFASFGIVILLLVLVVVVTGIALLPFYSATAAAAHRSVAAIQASMPLRVLRAVHHWSSAFVILLGAAYLVYGLFTSSYRRPLHLAWVASVAMVLLFLAFQLTGHILPWDVHAVSSAAIEAGIAENVPVIGPAQGRLVRGGDAISPRTLTVWYVAHVGLFPAALAVLAALFLSGLRRAAGRLLVPWSVAGPVLLALLLLSLSAPAPLGPAAAPEDYNSFASPPEWYILPMHGLLNVVQGINPRLAFVGTMVMPALAVLWLLALPWLDRRTVDQPSSRWVTGITAVGLVAVIGLSLINIGHMAPLLAAVQRPPAPTAAQQPAASTPLDPALIQKGKTVYEQNGCAGCHKIAGQGGAVGPPLDDTGRRHPDLDWQVRHLKDPAALVPGSTMPGYKQLSEEDLRALATYMLNLK